MSITRLNHAVLYVSDVERSVEFYSEVLGFRRLPLGPPGMKGVAFLQAPGSSNDHDLGLFEMGAGTAGSQAGRTTVGLYHLAWEIDTLSELERVGKALSERGALVGATDHGTTKSYYAKDPDGIEMEIAWIVPADQLDEAAIDGRSRLRALDIDREKARYGADSEGGIGISTLHSARG